MAITPSITAKPGFQFILKVADPTKSPTVFETVGGLRNTQLTINNNPADISNAASAGFREFLPEGGVQEFSLSADGVFDSRTPGARRVFNAAVNRELVEGMVVSGHGDAFIGAFVVQSCQRSGPFQDAEQFSIQLQGSGRIVYQDGVSG